MKTKKTIKKLVLNKNTISDLNRLEQNNVKGGVSTCETCETCETCVTCETCQTVCWFCPTQIPIRCSGSPSCLYEICLP